MPDELTLCTVSAVIGALLGGVTTYIVTHKIDGAALAHEQAAHADDIARINATAAQQLADAIAKGQAAEGKVATLTDQYQQEVAQHAKDSLDYRAKLLTGANHVRVRIVAANCGSASAASESASAANGNDGAAAYADLSPATAASAVAVVDDADAQVIKLRKLQAYVKGLQDDGYINR